jgi:hypothetical protein
MMPTISIPFLDDLEEKAYSYFSDKVPSIPAEAKETIVKFLPYAVILILLAQAAAIVSFFQISTVFDGLGYLYSVNPGVIGVISIILLGLALCLEAMALSYLFKHRLYGWRLLTYAVILTQINELINLNIINLLFSGLIILFILFQTRDRYR